MHRLALLLVCGGASIVLADLLDPLPPRFPAPEFQQSHPRVRVTDTQLKKVKQWIATDSTAKLYYERLMAYGDTLLTTPLINCTRSGVEDSLLSQARATLDRTYSLGLLYRLNGNESYARRAIKEMLHVCTSCTDWNPSHFLDTAEMTHAVAIGYDWLYSLLSDEEKDTIESGTLSKGLEAGITAYKDGTWFTTDVYNWNLVCNGGLLAGAIAFSDAPKTQAAAASVFRNATHDIPIGLSSFGPDGGWPEGTTYWGYATKYALLAVELMQALEDPNAQQLAAQYAAAPGFNATGLFRIQSTGPTHHTFNWGDSDGEGLDEFVHDFFHLAALPTVNPAAARQYAYTARTALGPNPSCGLEVCAMSLLAYSPEGGPGDIAQLPKSSAVRFTDSGWDGKRAIAVMRQGWADSNGPFVAFKAGNGQANHNDDDAGDFVLDWMGQRWAVDLGADSYGLKGYWDKSTAHGQRYSYYRKTTCGSNTLTFNNHNDSSPGWSAQDDDSVTEISLLQDTYGVVDLTAAYSKQGGPNPPGQPAKRVERGFAFTPTFDQLFLVDEIEFDAADNVTWGMHVKDATFSSDGSAATLLQKGVVLHACILEPAGAQFSWRSPQLAPPQDSMAGVNKLVVEVGSSRMSRIVVVLSPSAIPTDTPLPNTLSAWPTSGPFPSL